MHAKAVNKTVASNQSDLNSSPVNKSIGEHSDAYLAAQEEMHHFDQLSLHPPIVIQPKLSVNQPNDAYEREADAIADKVISMNEQSSLQPLNFLHSPGSAQRKCSACEEEEKNVQRKCAHCEEEEKGLQRKAVTAGSVSSLANTSTVANHITASQGNGRALDKHTQTFMSSRMGFDFSKVNIHADNDAASMNRQLNARAFTVGKDIYFNTGQYNPSGEEGKKLLAHELVHTIQQGGTQTQIQRACLPAAECAAPQATLENFVQETENKPENISKADKRKKACSKVPPDPACTSDGHGSQATALTSILNTNYKSRLGYITGIYVDKDMPASYAAVTYSCGAFVPPKPGGQCTFVPDVLEAQGKLYLAGNASIGGKTRQDWLTSTLGTLTHETEHARFNTGAPLPSPSSSSTCKFDDHKHNLSEMAAHLSEMHVFYRAALAKPGKDRFKEFYNMFNYWVKNGSEDISGIVKDLRCKCDCADADHFIKKTVESVSTSQKWDTNEADMIHRELKTPKWNLKWPVDPPSGVNVTDLPTEAPAPYKME
ncbi:DUF4157 domain-containing protein [Danxiaibacter flavus]|uniref:DUF4157 domain-containing protein n=1 Tax=Danxiaibacter flavus TaxID=3049108 RepID=A0ABV3ZF81_9BACT|nr:DUF4157 domain-containing protein [Chitinophagaceae bacterium DXS]